MYTITYNRIYIYKSGDVETNSKISVQTFDTADRAKRAVKRLEQSNVEEMEQYPNEMAIICSNIEIH